MKLANLPFPVYGDQSYRGRCPVESADQTAFFDLIRARHPHTWGLLAFHPRNTQLLVGGQLNAMRRHKREGLTKSVVDIIIPATRPFVCEMKRRDHTKSSWQDGQREYLETAQQAGAFACLALGFDGAWQAFEAWLRH